MNKLDVMLGFHEAALRVRAQRQELIASNIANADTPNYKARDINFSDVLKSALSGTAATGGLPAVTTTTTDSTHFAMTGNAGANGGNALYRPIIQGSVDGNTVDMDVERNQFADNGIRYEASLTLLNAQIKHMLTAIQGQ